MILRRLRGGGWFFSSAGAQAAAAALGFFTNIVYARTLELTGVGEIALVTSAALFCAVFADRGFGTWVTRNLASGVISSRASAVYLIRASLPVWIIGAVAVVFSLLLIPNSMMGSVSLEFAAQWWVLLISFTVFQGVISVTQGTAQTTLRSAVIVVNAASTLGCVFVVSLIAPSVSSYLWASALGYLTAAAVGFAGIVPTFSASVVGAKAPPYKAARSEARPLFASNAVTYAMGAGDVLLLAVFVGPAEIGLYQTAKKLAQAVSLPWSTVIPVLIGRVARSSQPSRLIRSFTIAAAVYFLLATAGSLLLGSFVLSTLFGESFAAATPDLIVLLIAFGCQLARDLTGAILIVRGMYGRIMVGQLVSLVVLGLTLPAVGITGSSMVFAMGLSMAFLSGTAVYSRYLRNSRQ